MNLLILASALAGDPLPILFLGNSHTAMNDCPGMVRQLFGSDGSQRKIVVEIRRAEFLEQFATDDGTIKAIKSRKWFSIVMQGLKMSSSHKYEYDHRGAVTLGKLAKQHAQRPVYFAEWPRAGWDEAAWIQGQYAPIGQATEVPVARLGLAWPLVLKEFPNLKLWTDGNHATPAGTYLAACGLYYSLAGGDREPSWSPKGLDAKLATRLRAHARAVSVGKG